MHEAGDVSAPPQEDFLQNRPKTCCAKNADERCISFLCWKAACVFFNMSSRCVGGDCRDDSMAEMPAAIETKVFLQKTEESKAF